MNWEAIGAIGEILGALAVFITLAYLATQIRQNTALMTTSVYESAMGGFNELNKTVLSSPELLSIQRRGFAEPSSLSAEELHAFNFILRIHLNHVYKLFRLYQRGVFPEAEWRLAATETNEVLLGSELGRIFVANNRYFDDLYEELPKYKTDGFTSFDMGQDRSA